MATGNLPYVYGFGDVLENALSGDFFAYSFCHQSVTFVAKWPKNWQREPLSNRSVFNSIEEKGNNSLAEENKMSDTLNPYQSPETAAVPVKPLLAQGNITETMLLYLKGASPWLRFIGILGFIASGLAVLWGVSMFAFVPMIWQSWDQVPGFESFSGIMGAAFGAGMVALSVGGALLVFFPALFIYRFGEKIRSYIRTGAELELELAFKNNKALWKFFGIICIIYLAFIPLVIVGGIIAGVAAVLS